MTLKTVSVYIQGLEDRVTITRKYYVKCSFANINHNVFCKISLNIPTKFWNGIMVFPFGTCSKILILKIETFNSMKVMRML